jgi:hypothetical protein
VRLKIHHGVTEVTEFFKIELTSAIVRVVLVIGIELYKGAFMAADGDVKVKLTSLAACAG